MHIYKFTAPLLPPSYPQLNSSGSMNSSPEHSHQSSFCGIGCAMVISFGILLLIIIIIFASYICTHGIQDPSRLTPSNEGSSITDQGSVAINPGLDEATLASYPKLLCSQEKSQQKVNHSLDSCCSICLGDYIDSDVLRLLPHCGHTFHLNCVDCWLRLNHTCPICRNLPVPTFSIPLAEVAPLATYRYWFKDWMYFFSLFERAGS